MDLLVRLYDLPAQRPMPEGIDIRRALPPERHVVTGWVGEQFSRGWASEVEMAFSQLPVTCWVAARDGEILGFACHDATAKGFFGPTGVAESARGKGIGDALLMAVMQGMREAGYGYAVIGGVGPVEFYRKRLDAMEIPGSTPGIYRGLLRSRA